MNPINVIMDNESQVPKRRVGALTAKRGSAQKIDGESRELAAIGSLG